MNRNRPNPVFGNYTYACVANTKYIPRLLRSKHWHPPINISNILKLRKDKGKNRNNSGTKDMRKQESILGIIEFYNKTNRFNLKKTIDLFADSIENYKKAMV